MATAEQYAAWIVENQDKQGTPEFETVAAAYKLSRAKPAPGAVDRTNALITGANKGIAGLAGLPMDTVQNVYNLGKAAIGVGLGMGGDAPEPTRGTPLSSEWTAQKLNQLGIKTENPRPDDPVSRMLHTGGVISGGSMVPGSTVKGTLAASIGGAVAGEALGDQYTALGAMAPAAAGQAIGAARNAVAAKVAPTAKVFEDTGTTASVGQATESSFFRGLENLAAKFPGGVGIMRNFADRQQKQLGDKTRTGVSGEDAGRAIESGVSGFLDRTKAVWKNLDNEVAAKIPRGAEISPVNTIRALDEMTAAPQGASATSKILTNPKLQEIYDAFKKDMSPPSVPLPGTEVPAIYKTIDRNVIDTPQSRIQKTIETAAAELHPHGYGQPSPSVSLPGTDVGAKTTMPYQTLRALRSKVGAMLDDSLVSGIPNGELKKLYGALSKDLEAAANQAGAGKEFQRQNNYYRARMERTESVLTRVVGKDRLPEDIFKNFMPKDANEANKVRAVMRSLDPSERKIVTDAVVDRLGKAQPGKQSEVGDVFSSETFLTNWNKLSPGAKAQLFPDQKMRGDLDAIAKVSSNIREGSKTFANPSGTAGAAAPYGLGALAFTGNVPAAAGLVGTAYIGAKMMTNPKVVNWLAKASTATPQEMAPHLARLGVIYNEAGPELRKELDQFMVQK